MQIEAAGFWHTNASISSIKEKQQISRHVQMESNCHECALTVWELGREGRQRPPDQKAGKRWQDCKHL